MTAGMGFSTTLGVVRHWIVYIIQQGFLPLVFGRPFALASAFCLGLGLLPWPYPVMMVTLFSS